MGQTIALKEKTRNWISARIRSPKHCWICKSTSYGPEIHHLYYHVGVDVRNLARTFARKLGYKRKQSLYAFQRTLAAHFDGDHKPGWIVEAEGIPLKLARRRSLMELGRLIPMLKDKLVDGTVSNEEYLEKVKLLSYGNMVTNPSKVSVRSGLEVIKLKMEQQKLGTQQSESLRAWMRVLSGLPDKESR